jgi:uncharacterized damage-inducible protein DinB
MPTEQNTSRVFIDQARSYLLTDYLPKIERCLEKLTDEQIWWRSNAQSNSIGNLLLHLAGNARQWIACGLSDAADHRVRQAEFDQREIISKADLLAKIRDTLSAVDRVLANFDEAKLLQLYQIQDSEVTALEAIFHVTEHFSMHTGQIIMLTKMMTEDDLAFYDFSTGAPVHAWNKP